MTPADGALIAQSCRYPRAVDGERKVLLERFGWKRRAQSIVDTIGPVAGRDRQHQHNGILLGEVLTQRVQVGIVDVAGPELSLAERHKRAVQLFLNSWSNGPFGPISISATGHLFTKQLLCQLSYGGGVGKGSGTISGGSPASANDCNAD